MKALGKISQKSVASDQVSMIEIDDSAAGQRIDNFLLRVCKGVPKSHIYRILRSGEVRVNKGRVDAQYRLELGDLVRVPPIRVAQPNEAIAQMPVPAAHFTILFEDEHMLVIDKPAGVAVHGGSGVAFGVIEQMREARPQAKFLELVHRLDRETSGVLMLAKKRAALVGLHEQIRENKMDKRYYACVHGEWASDWGRRRAVKEPLHKYLTADGERRVRVQPDGLASHTVFNLIDRWTDYALLEAELKTGRTHQIRVHLQHLELPIVGDAKYGDFALNKALARANARPGIKRMFLHAYRLKLTHPATGAPLQFEAPLPAECRGFIAQRTIYEMGHTRRRYRMAREQFDLIVFDWDGTLMDSTAHITRSIQSACRDLGLPVPADEAASYVIGLGLRDALQIAAPTLDPSDYPRLAERYRFHYLVKDQTTELFVGVREMLQELRDLGYLLAVATGKSRVGLNRALDQSHLTSLFDGTRCADETFSKPHPAMLHELTRELGQDPKRTVMVGDTTHDLQMAINAGVAGIGVTYGAHPAGPLTALEPKFVASSVSTLAGWLRENA